MIPLIPIYIILTTSALYYTKQTIQKKKELQREEDVTSDEKNNDSRNVSSRGLQQLKPPLPYLNSFFQCLEDPCTKTNPNGRIALCIAENKLILPALSNYLSNLNLAQVGFEKEDYYCYNDFRGLDSTREVIARFLTRNFLYGGGGGAIGNNQRIQRQSDENGNGNSNEFNSIPVIDRIRPDDVIIGSGCAGLLNSIFYTLAEDGEAVLIPAPYYAAFESDMKSIAKCVPVAVEMSKPSLGPTPQELDAASKYAESKGLTVRILLLTNPNNPLGVIYDKEVIQSCIAWSRSRKMHTIVDEIYALSVHDSSNNTFESVISILNNNLDNDVHMLWALSKDFGSSGFRIGVLYTQNQTLIQAMGNLNIFAGVSHPMQGIVSSLLSDHSFVDTFLESSRSLLKTSLSVVIETLHDLDIPYTQPHAGIFIYCDFSSLLPSATFEGEARFASFVEDVGRMVLTPGSSQRDPRPGHFRICYAWVSIGVLHIAMSRLREISRVIRTKGWQRIEEVESNDMMVVPVDYYE